MDVSSTITKSFKIFIWSTAQGKTTKVSFKSNISVSNPIEDWYRVVHIGKEIFDMASRRATTYSEKGQFNNLFSGIAKQPTVGGICRQNARSNRNSPVVNINCAGGEFKPFY